MLNTKSKNKRYIIIYFCVSRGRPKVTEGLKCKRTNFFIALIKLVVAHSLYLPLYNSPATITISVTLG